MVRLTPGGLSAARLRLILFGFFLALGVPAAVLVIHAYGQLKWEAFHQTRQLAQTVAERVDEGLQALVAKEDARGFAQFQFLVVRGKDASNFVQPSELSRFPVGSDIPGLMGYFQVDHEGRFSTPLLPPDPDLTSRFGIDARERELRAEREEQMLAVLQENGLARAVTLGAEDVAEQEVPPLAALEQQIAGASSLLDSLGRISNLASRGEAYSRQDEERTITGKAKETRKLNKQVLREEQKQIRRQTETRIDDLKLESPYPSAVSRDTPQRQRKRDSVKSTRKKRRELEQSAEAPAALDAISAGKDAQLRRERRITTFESELEPFELSRLDSGHLVLHRTAWRGGQRYTQGALIDHERFMDVIVGERFRNATLARMGQVTVAWNETVTTTFSGNYERDISTLSRSVAPPGASTLLYRTRLSAPASQMGLLFSVNRMPAGPGARVLAGATAVMALVLAGGLFLMYRLGLREIDLARQQQDFVAAVSHELRTPLTSIRMYGEMLREGWASEEKKRSYYDFIYNESERLSRLIANVLQLARMTRNDTGLELSPVSVGELMDGVRSKVSAQAQSGGFELEIQVPDALAANTLQVNADAFSQIMINLVDNAIKFSARAALRRVEVEVRTSSDAKRTVFSVRDHGPGIERDQMKKIFRLFYRSENELTRETVGTGIGLALVNRLARAMGAEVDVANADPGARFSLSFPNQDRRSSA